jgi:hypothetical protein
MDETTSSRITSMDNSATGREVFYDVLNDYGLTLERTFLVSPSS